jgi:hypothetical protein
MAPARLLVTRQQRVLVGLEEQHARIGALGVEIVEHRDDLLEEVAGAQVRHHAGALHLRSLVQEQLSERVDHPGRQVVDAEVPGVVEHVHRRRLAGAGEAGDHHQVRQAAHVTDRCG